MKVDEDKVKYIPPSYGNPYGHISGCYISRLFLHAFCLALGIPNDPRAKSSKSLYIFGLDEDKIEELVDAYNEHIDGSDALLVRFAAEEVAKRHGAGER